MLEGSYFLCSPVDGRIGVCPLQGKKISIIFSSSVEFHSHSQILLELLLVLEQAHHRKSQNKPLC